MIQAERHISAGLKSLAALEGLLGLKAGDTGWRLDGACALGKETPRVRLSLKSGAHRLVVYLLARSSAEARVRAAGLSLSAKGPAGPAVDKLLKVFAARLGERTLAEVVALLEADPLSFTEQVTPGLDGDRVKVPCIGQPMALLEAGWRNFYADQDFEVLLGVPSCSSDKTINIEYADLECYYARPKRKFSKWTFMDWPEESEDGGGSPAGTDGEQARDGSIVTELEERDMVMGTGERADALVAEVRKRAKPGDYLLFTHLCTPIIMGEDFSGLARRCEDEIGGSSVSWSQKDRDENDNFGAHFRSLLGAPGFFDGPGDPSLVNLFHFPRRVREEELRPLLAALGLDIGICVFPDVSFPALPSLPKARWQVFCERSSYPTKVRELLAASPRPVVSAPAPYGVEGTRLCLRAVAAAAGKEAAFDAAWAAKMSAFMPRWEELRAQAAGRRLAFVVSEATLPRLLELRYGHGAPLAAMVLEMGFGVDLVYYDRHGEPPALPAGLAGARVAVFRSPSELRRALREGDFAAVYSDIVFDWRVTRAGKARFSSKDFEMGLEGALRTIEKLLPLVRLPFYRQYAEHLRGRHDG
ncbi:MAG: nitrogenase component 1 [Elusimicrobiota bacterium]|nr:nitrogenase component 1 [Elusimicrobiota bacterium]